MRGSATPSILLWLIVLHDSSAYQPLCGVHSRLLVVHASRKDEYADRNHRRALLQSCGVAASSVLWNNPVEALDQSIADCLLDLPPKPKDVVRLYLCRHGQTENNRLHIVQGSRVDPPLNNNGVLMAERLAVLSRSQQPLTKSIILHSCEPNKRLKLLLLNSSIVHKRSFS
ncbi:hypothetical protein MHU86_24106 [Fragilaria crotonensis]|nr:hypothetical protein MHU86_24106 [Fragilaria crotonensis]